jgi:hypothetical protein
MTTKEHYSESETTHHEHRFRGHYHGHHRHHHHEHCGGITGALLEATILTPLALAEGVLETVRRCVTSVGCSTWCDSCNTCGCHCRCEYKPHHHRHPDCCGADLKIETRIGEVRQKMILVENNSPRPATITLEADPWLDSSGTQVGGTAERVSSIVFDPATVTLATCQSASVKATINVADPLQAGRSYFSRIYLRGCSRPPISVELCVAPDTRIDYYAECESCRPRCGHFVEFCEEDHECDQCRRHHWSPFGWLWDPCHWLRECCCKQFLLPSHPGSRPC